MHLDNHALAPEDLDVVDAFGGQCEVSKAFRLGLSWFIEKASLLNSRFQQSMEHLFRLILVLD